MNALVTRVSLLIKFFSLGIFSRAVVDPSSSMHVSVVFDVLGGGYLTSCNVRHICFFSHCVW